MILVRRDLVTPGRHRQAVQQHLRGLGRDRDFKGSLSRNRRRRRRGGNGRRRCDGGRHLLSRCRCGCGGNRCRRGRGGNGCRRDRRGRDLCRDGRFLCFGCEQAGIALAEGAFDPAAGSQFDRLDARAETVVAAHRDRDRQRFALHRQQPLFSLAAGQRAARQAQFAAGEQQRALGAVDQAQQPQALLLLQRAAQFSSLGTEHRLGGSVSQHLAHRFETSRALLQRLLLRERLGHAFCAGRARRFPAGLERRIGQQLRRCSAQHRDTVPARLQSAVAKLRVERVQQTGRTGKPRGLRLRLLPFGFLPLRLLFGRLATLFLLALNPLGIRGVGAVDLRGCILQCRREQRFQPRRLRSQPRQPLAVRLAVPARSQLRQRRIAQALHALGGKRRETLLQRGEAARPLGFVQPGPCLVRLRRQTAGGRLGGQPGGVVIERAGYGLEQILINRIAFRRQRRGSLLWLGLCASRRTISGFRLRHRL